MFEMGLRADVGRNIDVGARLLVLKEAAARAMGGRLIHPRLPHYSPHAGGTHPFRPRIHPRPICRQTSS